MEAALASLNIVRLILFSNLRQKIEGAVRKDCVNPAFTLALLQHLPRESRTKPPRCALIACISDRRRSR